MQGYKGVRTGTRYKGIKGQGHKGCEGVRVARRQGYKMCKGCEAARSAMVQGHVQRGARGTIGASHLVKLSLPNISSGGLLHWIAAC